MFLAGVGDAALTSSTCTVQSNGAAIDATRADSHIRYIYVAKWLTCVTAVDIRDRFQMDEHLPAGIRPVWHDRRVTIDQIADDDPPARRMASPPDGLRFTDSVTPRDPRPEVPGAGSGAGGSSARVPALLGALSALVAGVVLTVGSQFAAEPFTAVVVVVQLALVLAWYLQGASPNRSAIAVIAAVGALAADGLALLGPDRTIGGLAGIVVAVFGAAIVVQMLRGAQRQHVTEAFGTMMFLAVTMVALASMISLRRHPDGDVLLLAVLAAAGAAMVVARLLDLVLARPAMHGSVPRGVVGVIAGSVVGAVAGAVMIGVGELTTPPPWPAVALAAWGVALVAVLTDVASGFTAVGRSLVTGTAPSRLAAVFGPLLGTAFAASAGYVFGLVLLS